jgi:hypothetical protein
MDTLIYGLLMFSVFASIFLFGWQFGCWMVQRDNRKQTRDCYTDEFYNDYYAGSCCKRDQHHHKPKAKKGKKVSKN